MSRPVENRLGAGLGDRLGKAAEARKVMLDRFKDRPAADDPAVIARNAERAALAAARDARLAEREAERKATSEREESARAESAAREAAESAQAQAAQAEAVENRAAEQKAARDARYAARKARKG